MNDDEPEFFYEGYWTRFTCPKCGDQTEVEGDARGDAAKCENCGFEGVIGS